MTENTRIMKWVRFARLLAHFKQYAILESLSVALPSPFRILRANHNHEMGNDKKHGQYSGVPTDAVASAVASSHGDASLPIATAVSLTGGSGSGSGTSIASRRGSSASTNQTPTKTQQDSTSSKKSSANIHDVAGADDDGNDGIQITWEKGEVQQPAFRDIYFAIAFVAHLAAVLAASFVLGPAAWNSIKEEAAEEEGADADAGAGADADANANTDDRDEDGNGDGYDNDNNIPGAANFWITVVTIATIAAPTLSLLTLGVMSRNAASLIRASLWFSVVLCGMAALIFLPLAPPAGILYMVMTGCLVCYARSVQHKIQIAACNLTCAIRVVKANLGIALVALGVLVALIAFSFSWTLAFVGTMSLDALKEPVPMDQQSYNTYNSNNDDDKEELNGLGGGLAILFLLSFYWTHQVLQNVLRSSVAGVVGTWWFTPLEASSFCSPAVRDSFLRSSTYSLGSVAFGSLIVAILQLLRSMLRSAANDRNNRNGILHCIAACILLYLERIVEYFNKWAYIYVGLYGYDYISAGKKVMGLFKTRGWTAIIADNLVNRLLGIVCLTIGLLTGVATLLAALLVEELESTGGWLGAGFT